MGAMGSVEVGALTISRIASTELAGVRDHPAMTVRAPIVS